MQKRIAFVSLAFLRALRGEKPLYESALITAARVFSKAAFATFGALCFQ